MLIRTALIDRRLRVIGTTSTQGYNKWLEADRTIGEAMVRNLRSLHLIDQRRLERYRRQAGPILWTQ